MTNGLDIFVDDEDYDFLICFGWCLHTGGYAVANIAGKITRMHRLIMGEDNPKVLIDHINGYKLDNRKVNLRKCAHSGNNRNQKNLSIHGFKGVFPHGKNGWRARITVNYKSKNLGTYKTKHEAAMAYNLAAVEFHGEFASLNNLTGVNL